MNWESGMFLRCGQGERCLKVEDWLDGVGVPASDF